MTCRDIRELMPWLANGTLDPQAAREVRSHVEGCEACRDDLRDAVFWQGLLGQHPPIEALISYAREGQSAKTAAVEEHLETCERCAAQVAAARQGLAAVREVRVQPPRGARAGRWGTWSHWAAAALLLLVSTIALWQHRKIDSKQQEIEHLTAAIEAQAEDSEARQGELAELDRELAAERRAKAHLESENLALAERLRQAEARPEPAQIPEVPITRMTSFVDLTIKSTEHATRSVEAEAEPESKPEVATAVLLPGQILALYLTSDKAPQAVDLPWRRQREESGEIQSGTGRFDELGELRLVVTEPGTYTLEVALPKGKETYRFKVVHPDP